MKPLDIFMTLFWNRRKGTFAKKVSLRDANEDVDKVCIEVQKTSDNTGGKPTGAFSLNSTQTFSALCYAQDFGNRVKGSVKRTTSSTFTEMSNFPMPNAFMPLLALSAMSLSSVQTMTKEDEVGMGVDWRENFPPVYHQTIRSKPTQDKAGTLPSASRDYVMLSVIFLKS